MWLCSPVGFLNQWALTRRGFKSLRSLKFFKLFLSTFPKCHLSKYSSPVRICFSHFTCFRKNTLKELRHSFKFFINFASSFNVCHLQSIWYQSSAFLTNLVHSRFHPVSNLFGVCHSNQTIIERFPFNKQNFSANQKGKKKANASCRS